MLSYLYILAVVSLFSLGISRGEGAGLDQIGVQVVRENPELTAARFMIEEAKGRQLGSGRLMNPEIEAGATRMMEGREGGFNIGLMQRFPVTSRLRLEKGVTSAQVAAAAAEVADMTRKLIAEAEMMAVKILAMRAEAAVQEAQATLAEKLA